MKLSRVVNDYIAYKRSLGMRFMAGEAQLKAFVREMGDIEIEHISPDATLSYLTKQGRMNPNKLSIIRCFYRFAMARGHVSFSPLPKTIPKQSSTFVPYIYSREELGRLIAATDTLKENRDTLIAPTMRTLLILLYGAGLRCGEALRLTVSDVNLVENLLTIRESKFYKTRLVPISPQLTVALSSYFQKRRLWHRPIRGNSAFFATSSKAALTVGFADRSFKKLRTHAGLYRLERGRSQPRLHDLRHTSAVHRLIAWYREGKDVQTLLPYLSTYLGHVKLSGTKCYLSMTPELLEEVNHRFEGYALSEVNHV